MKTKNNSIVNQHITQKVIELRKKNGYTQEQISQVLGISRTSLVNIENCRHHVNATMIYVLSCLYEVEVSVFYPELVPIKLEVKTKKKRITKIITTIKPVKLK